VSDHNGNGRSHQFETSQRIFPKLSRLKEQRVLIAAVGLAHTIVLQQLVYRFRPEFTVDGWTSVTYESLAEQIGCTARQVKRSLTFLRRKDIAVVYCRTERDSKCGWLNWWWIDRGRIEELYRNEVLRRKLRRGGWDHIRGEGGTTSGGRVGPDAVYTISLQEVPKNVRSPVY
jgi:hypothetical protein